MRRARFLGGAALALALPRAVSAATAEATITDLVNAFPGIVGIYARELGKSTPLVSVRGDEPFAAASVIKLGIMLAVYRAYDAGDVSPHKLVTLHKRDIIGGSPVYESANPGERHEIQSLVEAMIRFSDNTASNALISAFDFPQINEAMRSAGMTGTKLARHFADVVPPNVRSLNVTTPRDIGTLLYHIENGAHEGTNTVARAASCRAMLEIMLGQHYRDMIPAGIARKVPIANKTGELERTRNDAAVVDPFGDAPYVLTVLSRDLDYPGLAAAHVASIAKRVDTLAARSAAAE